VDLSIAQITNWEIVEIIYKISNLDAWKIGLNLGTNFSSDRCFFRAIAWKI
jgi:hypothetical protein